MSIIFTELFDNFNWEKPYTISYDKCRPDTLSFSNKCKLSFVHYQDCCECVGASLEDASPELYTESFTGIPQIEFVEDAGIRINKCFIPCYNMQNGWYSSYLELMIHGKGRKLEHLCACPTKFISDDFEQEYDADDEYLD